MGNKKISNKSISELHEKNPNNRAFILTIRWKDQATQKERNETGPTSPHHHSVLASRDSMPAGSPKRHFGSFITR